MDYFPHSYEDHKPWVIDPNSTWPSNHTHTHTNTHRYPPQNVTVAPHCQLLGLESTLQWQLFTE